MFGFLQGVTDPICKLKVIKNKAKYSSEYKGEKYLDPKDRKLVYFCSENCKKSFDEEPGKHIAEGNTSTKICCQQNTKSCC
ncbi:YHS domain-containing protein [Candidatus Daviesbacteria bacterium]|nr:YHS domain-containing protein [Candidatus Daviesbacteria bacterium]